MKRKKKDNKKIFTVIVCVVAAVLLSVTAFICLSEPQNTPFVGEKTTQAESTAVEMATTENTAEITSEENKEILSVVVTTAVTTTAATTEESSVESSTENQITEPTDAVKTVNENTGRIIVNPEQELWNLVVVNMGREMPSGYKPKLDEILSTGCYMDERVVPFYERMYNAAKKEGIILTPYSGYRSYERQERNYKNLTETYMSDYGLSRKEAAKKAATVILPPGTSEHNLGLAMDIINTKNSFASTKEYKWLTENAHKYGFILRYTADKMHITGIVDEPWHWRFVGVEYAEDIKNSGLCLEEYLQLKGIDF